jgi:predicted transcriptional regulator
MPIEFGMPGQYEAVTATVATAEWVLLVFSGDDVAFQVASEGTALLENHTATQLQGETSTGRYTPFRNETVASTDLHGPFDLEGRFDPARRGSLFIEARSIELMVGRSTGLLTTKPDGESLEALSRPADIDEDLHRMHSPPGPHAVITAEAGNAGNMSFDLRVQDAWRIEWYDAAISCSAGSCPTGGGPHHLFLPGPPGHEVALEQHTYESLVGHGMGMTGRGDLDYAVVGASQLSAVITGQVRLPLASAQTACETCPAGQTIATDGVVELRGLKPSREGLSADLQGDLRSARLDEQAIDPVVLTGASIAVVTGTAIAAFVFAKALLGSLFTRVRTPAALDNPYRQRLFHAISENPGISFNALRDHCRMANGTARHHVGMLQRLGMIDVKRIGNATHHFPRGTTPDRVKALAHLQAPGAQPLLEAIRQRPGIGLRGLQGALPDLPRSTLQFRLAGLRHAGLVLATKQGRTLGYSAAVDPQVLTPVVATGWVQG